MHRWLCWGYLNERNHSQDLDVDGRIILKCILRKRDGMVWTDWFVSGYRQVAGCCECGNEPSGFTICGEFLD